MSHGRTPLEVVGRINAWFAGARSPARPVPIGDERDYHADQMVAVPAIAVDHHLIEFLDLRSTQRAVEARPPPSTRGPSRLPPAA